MHKLQAKDWKKELVVNYQNIDKAMDINLIDVISFFTKAVVVSIVDYNPQE